MAHTSLWAQTLCDDVLCRIGRAHDTEMFYEAYEIARASGIPVINTDLIAGLPGKNPPVISKNNQKNTYCT